MAKYVKVYKMPNTKTMMMRLLVLFVSFISLIPIFLFLFFKTPIFQTYKEIWVQTAMSTDNHKYLATWFLSDEEIDKIMRELEVVNNEDSNIGDVEIKQKENIVTVENIAGTGYRGYVILVSDPSKVKLIDTRFKNRGKFLRETIKEKDAIAGINAGGFIDPNGRGMGNILADATIMDGELLNGKKGVEYKFIGLSKEGELILAKCTYEEAIEKGIDAAIEFGPYLIVNGKNQITNKNSGGIQPRTAIGQKKDGTIIFVCIDGRQVSSLGCTFFELQEIFNRYDAYNAANLDGGSSSVMYYDDKLINKPCGPSGERYLPNAIIVEK